MAQQHGSGALAQLDQSKLQGIPEDQQQIYVMSFVRDLERLVDRLDNDGASAHQLYVQKELLKVLRLTTPPPSRLIRNLAGRCFAEIFRKGDRKLLFDTINELLSMLNVGKAEKDLRGRHATIYCLGEVFGAAGDSATQMASLAATSILKTLKIASNHCGLRAAVYQALGKLYVTVAQSSDESVVKDVYKSARTAASSDKSYIVQIAALQCIDSVTAATPYFKTTSDFDKVLSTVLKALESPSGNVRKAAAKCLSNFLIGAYSADAVDSALISKNSKRTSILGKATRTKSIATEDDLPERPMSPGPKKSTLMLSLDDILRHLCAIYTKSSTSTKLRAGIALVYIELLTGFDAALVETNYIKIANHLFNDLLSHNNITSNRFRLLSTRKYVRIILEDVIGRRLLGETGQLNAVKALVNNIIKNYPAVIKERPEPSKYALTAAIHALSSLIRSLGSVITSTQELVREGLLQVLQHPSYTVQLATSYCLKCFVLAAPSQLLSILTILMNNVHRELGQLSGNKKPTPETLRRCVGFANGLAAVLSTVPVQPLYASVDVTNRILTQATQLLKSSGDVSDLRTSSTQIQVAWILIGGLMSLGPNFVKIHLSQLLLLWKNALPKPLARDSVMERSLLEVSFLAHVRECALSSIFTFLEFNSRLVTVDVGKRIAAMLQNTVLFLNGFPSKRQIEDPAQRLSPSLQLIDLEHMVKRRVLQCYVQLVNLNHGEVLQANLLTQAVSLFADPENYTPSSLSTAIASSAGSFESLWDIGDGYSYGVCSFVNGYEIATGPSPAEQNEEGRQDIAQWMASEEPLEKIEQTLNTPILGSLEHDSVSLYTSINTKDDPQPAPPATAVVNTAINLFKALLPLQPPKVQESILEQIATFLASNALSRNPGRKAAMTVNIAVALFATLKVATTTSSSNLNSAPVLKIMSEILQIFIINPDPYVRNIAYEAIGRICSIGGNAFTGVQINFLIDTIVNNRDPNARAGCSMALGCIYSQVGGMVVGSHLKTIYGILASLCTDTHPIVQFWALAAMRRIIDSAGLTFSGFITGTLGMLATFYSGEAHEAGLISSNLELELPILEAIVRCIDSLIGILGPDLQVSKARDLIVTLVALFLLEPKQTVLREDLRCLEHMSLFGSNYLEFKDYISLLQVYLPSSHWELRDAAIDGLYQLMKGDASRVIQTAGPTLEEQFWMALNVSPEHQVVRNIILNWLSQTAIDDFKGWVDRFQAVMTKTIERTLSTPGKPAAAATEVADDEVASFAVSPGGAAGKEGDGNVTGKENLKWQARTFAMGCLRELLSELGKELRVNFRSELEDRAVAKIADVIRMAFSASTSNVVELRICGLKIVDQVLKIFGQTPDPDFPEAPLLEQYQAQISSALTPAFNADSSPELAAEAVNVCAAFISTGVVQDVDRMGRILKLLINALQSFSGETETSSIGELKGLSSNAQVMVKMSVLSAWAELQVASAEQKYLVGAVKPHIKDLAPLWLSSLREFARLRFEPDISNNPASPPGTTIDSMYSALNRETLLKFYQDSWLKLVDAIASLIEEDSQFVYDALDGKSPSTAGAAKSPVSHNINYRDEPVAFFFVLFGIAFEALVGRSSSDSVTAKEQTLEILLALKKILHPSVCGQAVYQEHIFSETMDLLDRLVLTEGLPVQRVIVDISRQLCISHPAARSATSSAPEKLSEDVDQLFELTRIVVLVLAGLLPNLNDQKKIVRNPFSEEASELIRASLDALVDAAEVFPSVIRMDLYASILHIFVTIFGTGVCQEDVIPRSLATFKRFITGITRKGRGNDQETVVIEIRGCLNSILDTLHHASIRGEVGLPCFRNTLLASTMVITAGINVLSPSDELIGRLCDAVVSGLDEPEVSTTAAHCARSLLMISPKTAADQEIVRRLIPKLIEFITSEDEESASIRTAKSTVSQILVAFLTTLFGEQIQIALSLFIPTILERASNVRSEAIYRESAARLLEMASANQNAFKAVVASLTQTQRSFMEEVLRSTAGGPANGTSKVASDDSAPAIALKMSF